MIIYGWRRYVQVLAALMLVCQRCSRPAEHVLRRFTTKVTLFFIPLFPVSRSHTLTCGACNGEFRISREQAKHLAASAGPQQQCAGPPAQQPAYGQPAPGPYGGPPGAYPQQPGVVEPCHTPAGTATCGRWPAARSGPSTGSRTVPPSSRSSRAGAPAW
jgi:hypothetical protein